MKTLRRTITPVVKVLDEKAGIVEYVASDEAIDADREIVRAKGWRFDYMQKNAPFVDSHDYSTVEKLLGKVIDFSVADDQLVETVKWAVDVAENRLAQLGFKMTMGGFLKSVSVGFKPVKSVSYESSPKDFKMQLAELGLPNSAKVKIIFLEQQQMELSAVIIGSNPNALAKAYKAEVIKDDDLDYLAKEFSDRSQSAELETADSTDQSALVEWAEARTRKAFWESFEKSLQRINQTKSA